MQWMNQSGTLKITHRARVKFSVGNYVDSVNCNVVPMTACQLLLGQPWQFDLDATHSGRSNNYSFVHKGVHHVLKLMSESTIKADMFATAKKKKEAFSITPGWLCFKNGRMMSQLHIKLLFLDLHKNLE